MTNTKHFQLRFPCRCPPHRYPPRSPPPSFPPPRLSVPSQLRTPHPFCADRWVHKGVSAPTIATPLRFTHLHCTGRPTCVATPFASPLSSRAPRFRALTLFTQTGTQTG